MELFLFIVCFLASGAGGAGGGVIIKPVLDFAQAMPVAAVSFCSGCTVLAMAVLSLLMARNGSVKVEWRSSTPLAIGAAVGGIAGKAMMVVIILLCAYNIVQLSHGVF